MATKRRRERARRRAIERESARSAGPADAVGSAQPPEPNDHLLGIEPKSHFSRRDLHAFLGLLALVAVAYFPALSGGFVWDDVIFAEEPVIHRWSGLWNIWFSPADIKNEGHYWPLVYTSFWLEHKLWGLAPLGYHLVNVLLHLVNVVLVWRLARRLSLAGAWAIAALFAVHPLHVESVAWVIERKDLLSAMFYLGAVLVWLRFAEAPALGRYCLALGLFTAGLLSKSIVVTLPAALMVLHWWKQSRVSAGILLRLAPFFLVGLGITAADLAFYVSREPLALDYTLVERLLIAARAPWFYVGKLLWPVDLAVIYPLWEIRAEHFVAWAYLFAGVALLATLWLLRRRIGRGPLAGLAFFLITLSPVLGFVDFGYMQFSFVADRFQYLAGLGVIAVLVGVSVHSGDRLPSPSRVAARGAFVAVLLVLGILTWRQSGIYRDEITFFTHIVSLNQLARDAHLNLGSALFDADRLEEGMAASRVAVEQRPDAAGAHANLGRALLLEEDLDKAEAHLSRALELDPRSETAQQNMAEVRRKQGRHDEAIEWFLKVVDRDDANALALAGLGVSQFETERFEQSLASIERALVLDSESPRLRSLHGFAGRALMALGRFDAAEKRMLLALENSPEDVSLLLNLSDVYVSQQRYEKADELLQRALALSPRDTTVLQNVAEMLRKEGRYEEALPAYRAVLAVDPEFAMAHAGKGDTLFRLGRYEEAIDTLAHSVDLPPHPPTATARLVLMGSASQALGRNSAAVGYYERAVEIDPRNAEALDHLAMTRFQVGRYEEALELYRALIEVQPESAQSHANLGSTLYYLERPEEALQSFEHALSLDPELEYARSSAGRLRESLGDSRP